MNKLLNQRQECCCLLCGDMYTDPKRLECGHMFCHQCLLEKTGRETECPDPDCRQTTLPDSRKKVGQLQTDSEMVDRVRRLLRQGLMALGVESRLKKYRTVSVALSVGAKHRSAMCDHCMKKGLEGTLYKCGMCSDYDLCETCFALPRGIVHWAEHIFLPMKKRKTLSVPDGPYISDGAMMGNSQDYSSQIHEHSKCDNCGVSPIEGTRFKCGMCDDYNLCDKCEKKSLEIHDKHHIFLVLPYSCTDPAPGRQIPYEFYDHSS